MWSSQSDNFGMWISLISIDFLTVCPHLIISIHFIKMWNELCGAFYPWCHYVKNCCPLSPDLTWFRECSWPTPTLSLRTPFRTSGYLIRSGCLGWWENRKQMGPPPFRDVWYCSKILMIHEYDITINHIHPHMYWSSGHISVPENNELNIFQRYPLPVGLVGCWKNL